MYWQIEVFQIYNINVEILWFKYIKLDLSNLYMFFSL